MVFAISTVSACQSALEFHQRITSQVHALGFARFVISHSSIQFSVRQPADIKTKLRSRRALIVHALRRDSRCFLLPPYGGGHVQWQNCERTRRPVGPLRKVVTLLSRSTSCDCGRVRARGDPLARGGALAPPPRRCGSPAAPGWPR